MPKILKTFSLKTYKTFFYFHLFNVCDKQIDNDGSSIALTQLERPLEEENLFRGSCSLPSDDVTSWVTKYMFNVSFDRKQFTQTFSFFIYQSECQYHTVEKGYDHFILKVHYVDFKKIKHYKTSTQFKIDM